MAFRTILVSNDHDLISQIAQACESTQAGGSLVFVENRQVSEVRELIDASGEAVGAVIVDLSGEGGEENGLGVLRALGEAYPDIALGAAHPAPSAELILSAMRAGAAEFLTPPYDVTRLTRERKSKLLGAAEPSQGKVIAFMAAQSGNGASTAALHAACAAAQELKEKVLLVELDFHCSVLRERLKIEADRGIAEILERTDNLDELWPWVVHSWNGVDLLPSPASSRRMASKSLQKLQDVLRFAASRYSTVILDLPSALMTSNRDVLALASEMYLICTPEVSSLHLARRRAFELMELGMLKNSLRIVVNRAGSGQPMPTDDLAQVIGFPVYCSLGNDYLALTEAWEQARLVSSQARLGQQLYELGAAMVGNPQPGPKQRPTWKSLTDALQATRQLLVQATKP